MTPPVEREHVKDDTVMDVTEERIARLYAKAFLGAVSHRDNSAALVEEVQSLADDVLARFPALEDTLRSSLVSHEQKERVLDRVFGPRASEVVLHFLKVLAKHDRLGLLRQIARQLKQLYAQQLGLTDVELQVASPLDDQLRQEIYQRLKAGLKSEPVLRVSVDPSLIAGLVIRVGDRVFDGSVANQFELARRAMIARVVERIETKPETFVVA
jgi:F-type H+-transporting ATPase subunit delta